MNSTICKTALICGLFCLPVLPNIVHAEVTPEQFNLLMTAAKKDGGTDFNVLVNLLVATHPDDEVEIREVAAQILSANPPVAEAPTPPPAPTPTPIPVEGTILSDDGADALSRSFLQGWEKEVEINVLYSTGNTSQKSFGAATKFERESGRYHQTATTYFDFNSSNSVTNKRRYGIAYKSDYSINEVSYVTGFASIEGDSFGPFNKRFAVNAGYGLRVFDNDTYKWSIEAGPAMLIEKPIATVSYETTLTAFASSLFTWAINERNEFENETKIYVGNKVVLENKSDYKVQISGALSGKLSFDVLYNRDAPIGRKKTDTITRIGILYDF